MSGRKNPAHLRRRWVVYRLDVQVPHIQRVVFDELAARFDGVAHQDGEDLVRLDRVVNLTSSSVRFSGFIVVSQSCSGFISPSPL